MSEKSAIPVAADDAARAPADARAEAPIEPAAAAPPAAAAASNGLRHNRGFLLFWSGQSISQLGDQVSALALPLTAVALLHASTFEVSALAAVSGLPALLGAPAGTWIDRRADKRALMLAADLGRAAVLLSLPAAAALGRVTLLQLYLVALLTGALALIFNTTYTAFFARLVHRDAYIAANTRLSVSQSAAQVAGPALGGALVQALGAPTAVLADAVSFLASAAFLSRIRPHRPEGRAESESETEPGSADSGAAAADQPSTSFRSELRQGWTFVTRDPIIRASLAGTTTINFFTFLAGTSLVVLFATRTLGLSAATIGVTFGVGATGSLLGALIAGRLAALLGVGRAVAVGAVLFPAPFALGAAAGGPFLLRTGALAAAEFLIGAGVMIFDVNQNAILVASVPDGLRSRVAGVYSSINYGVRPVASLAGGLLATHIGLRATLLTTAAGGSLSLLWFLASPIPRIRTLDMIEDLRRTPDVPGADPGDRP